MNILTLEGNYIQYDGGEDDDIKAKTIVKALVKFFTFVGLPKSVQSDQGSNFMSGVFQQVMHELGIKRYRSSAHHVTADNSTLRIAYRFIASTRLQARSACNSKLRRSFERAGALW